MSLSEEEEDVWPKHPAPEFDRKHVHISDGQTALLVIDMQNHFADLCSSAMQQNVCTIVKELYQRGFPVYFTQHGHKNLKGSTLVRWWTDSSIIYGSKDWEFQPAMQRLINCHYFTKVIRKSTYDAFQGTELQDELISKNINTVVVTGTMTNLCCETTARSAFCKNFDVLLVGDATSTCSDGMHFSSLINLSFGFARVVGTRQLLKQLCNMKK